MTAFDHSSFLQALGWAILNSLWQTAILWIVFTIITGLSGSIKPSQKSAIAASLLFIGFAWFVLTFISLIISRENNNAIVDLRAFSPDLNEKLNAWLNGTLPLASVIYMSLLVIPLLHFARNYRYVQVLRKYNLSKIDVDWRIFIKKVAAQIGISRPVQIWVSDLITSPVTVGYLKPIILVPLAAINHLTPEQMEAVLLHELAHIRRYDYLVNLLINFIQTILYFNPFVKAFVKTIERERERSCDEMVIQFQYNPHHYASALLMLEKNNVIAQNMAMAASGKNDLLNRIERILNIEKKHVFSFNKLAGLFAGLLCIIIMNAILIVDKPGTRSASFTFEPPASPANVFMMDDDTRETTKTSAQKREITFSPVENHIKEQQTVKGNNLPIVLQPEAANGVSNERETDPVMIYSNVALNTQVLPQLDKHELNQVHLAVTATKKVLEEQQWKEVEKSIADVMTSEEKQAVKQNYLSELSGVNWNKLEAKLKISYDQLNWNQINARLNTAVTSIKLDSLQLIYTIANKTLANAEKMATAADSVNVQVPLPDVSIEEIKQTKAQVIKNLRIIKAIRNRKVIHL